MENKLNDKLSKRFISGLHKYNLTYEDIKKNWYYMGGEQGIHKQFFERHFNNEDLPPHNNFCICGHKINHNCFISDGEYVLSIGASCINKFVRKLNRVCESCGDRHRNRKDGRCNKCRNEIKRVFDNYILCFN